jgi:hypothetical protein
MGERLLLLNRAVGGPIDFIEFQFGCNPRWIRLGSKATADQAKPISLVGATVPTLRSWHSWFEPVQGNPPGMGSSRCLFESRAEQEKPSGVTFRSQATNLRHWPVATIAGEKADFERDATRVRKSRSNGMVAPLLRKAMPQPELSVFRGGWQSHKGRIYTLSR